MKPRSYPILVQAIESGALYGYRSAFKHKENPDEADVVHSISNAILNEISEWFSFDDEN